jgi:hypothetical protein
MASNPQASVNGAHREEIRVIREPAVSLWKEEG